MLKILSTILKDWNFNMITENIIDIKNIEYVFILFLKLFKAMENTLII